MRIVQIMAGADRGGAETAFVDMCIALQQQIVTKISLQLDKISFIRLQTTREFRCTKFSSLLFLIVF